MLLPLDGFRLAYDDLGSHGLPAVCLVPSLVADGGMWAEQVPMLLAAGYRVLRIDLRGHGGSDEVPGPYTMRMLAGDVVAMLERLGIAQAHWLGSSLGGMVAQAAAIHHPHKVRSLMLCGSLPRSPDANAMWDERVRLVTQAGSCAPLADGILARWFPEAFRRARPARWQQLHDTLAATSALGFLGCAAAIRDFDFTPDLPQLRLPLLVTCGREDVSTPEAENRLLASLVPGGRYESIPDARHLANVEQPELFNTLLADWLRAQQ